MKEPLPSISSLRLAPSTPPHLTNGRGLGICSEHKRMDNIGILNG